jgi:hypothetical protein
VRGFESLRVTPIGRIQRAVWCWHKIRCSRTLRCLLPRGHKGPHQHLHSVIATFEITPELVRAIGCRRGG